MKLTNLHLILLATSFLFFSSCKAQESALWNDFVKSSTTDSEPILPDFSYAGYKYSEVLIPDVAYQIFDVTDFGAVANDGMSDKKAIKKTIAAAIET